MNIFRQPNAVRKGHIIFALPILIFLPVLGLSQDISEVEKKGGFVEITADEATLDIDWSEPAEIAGNVTVSYDSGDGNRIILRSPKVLVFPGGASVEKFVAYGGTTMEYGENTASCEKLTYSFAEQKIDLEGGVEIRQGGDNPIDLRAPVASILQGPSGMEKLIADGGVTAEFGPNLANAQKLTYDFKEQMIYMEGEMEDGTRPTVRDNEGNAFQAKEMEYNVVTGKVKMTGRTKMVLPPP